jgi:peptide/nickel transport system substrate-binding protein
LTGRGTAIAICAASVVLVVTVTACTSSKKGGRTGQASRPSAKSGGTLNYLINLPVAHWDPQRMYLGRDIAEASRMFYRTLTQLTPDNKLVADLATDTGKASDGNKTWTFTLKPGPKWQDGTPVTCQDIKYGVSRTFAVNTITGGPNYAIQFLDIPTKPDGSSQYEGPYTKKGQALFDKAVVCSGNTITFHLRKPVGDFNYAVSGALAAFAPFKASQDKGAQSSFQVFSDGPYMLQGTWQDGKGGSFVRNPTYDPSTDYPGIRNALPNKVVFQEGISQETIFDRLLKDQGPDRFAVTGESAPPAFQSQVNSHKSRASNSDTPFIDYVVPNFKRMTNPLVRQALAAATDKASYVIAYGGPGVATPVNSIIQKSVSGYLDFANPVAVPDQGDPAKAKSLLHQAGAGIPYPIHYTYPSTPTADAQASALQAAWQKAGFKVTLQALAPGAYSDAVGNPHESSRYDVVLGSWGADWPNASTVIPPLFDSRVNLSEDSTGQDFGSYASDATNNAIDAAYDETDTATRNAMWGDLSEQLAKECAYIALSNARFLRLHGSSVTNYHEGIATAGYPDLGQIAVSS